jgi:hypothetical protein
MGGALGALSIAGGLVSLVWQFGWSGLLAGAAFVAVLAGGMWLLGRQSGPRRSDR